MPTYQYRCKSCSHEFEEIQKFSDETLIVCPSCKKDTLVRVISGAGLVFKGSGFYLTDYKKSGGDAKSGDAKSGDAKSGDAKSGDAKKESAEKKETKETKPEANSESKSDAKPETKSSESTSSKPKGDASS